MRSIIIVAAANKERANAVLAAMGYGPESFGAPLCPAGPPQSPEPTHHATNWQFRPADKVAVVAALIPLGALWTDQDHYDPAVARPTFEEVLASRNMKPYVYEEPPPGVEPPPVGWWQRFRNWIAGR